MKKISNGSCIIADTKGTLIIEGSNPDFESIQQMYSHRAELFDIFTVFLFLDEYYQHYMPTSDLKVI